MNRALSGLVLGSVLGLNQAAADTSVPAGAPSCPGGALAIQVDQLFERSESYEIGREGTSSFAPRYSRRTLMTTVTRRSHGEARTTVPLSIDGSRVQGVASMTMEADDRIRARTASCSRKRTFAIQWHLNGTISGQCDIHLTVVRDWTEQPLAPCSADVIGMFGIYPPFSQSWSASVKAEHGAVTKREDANFKAKDFTTLTVVRGNAASQ